MRTYKRSGHPESNWASFRELRHVRKCGRARTRAPISREKERERERPRRESARWNGGRRRKRTAGRGFETASRIYRTSGLPPRPDLLVSAREFLHAAADVQPRTCATPPTSRFLAVLMFTRLSLSGYTRVTRKARFFGLECKSRVLYETSVLVQDISVQRTELPRTKLFCKSITCMIKYSNHYSTLSGKQFCKSKLCTKYKTHKNVKR